MTRITGHRGARGLWPENSVSGFRQAITLDLDAIEFDVHLTRAGELVVIHDNGLERTTDGTGAVRDLTPTGRAATRLIGSNESIPTLDDVLTVLAPATETDLHVEIKPPVDGGLGSGIVELVVSAIEEHRVRRRCHLSSFDVGVLAECRRIDPDIPRLVSVDPEWAARQGGLVRFLDGVTGLVDIVAVHRRLLTQHWDACVRAVGAERLCVWTVNQPNEISGWFDRGVGHLTTDRPDLALAARAARAVTDQRG